MKKLAIALTVSGLAGLGFSASALADDAAVQGATPGTWFFGAGLGYAKLNFDAPAFAGVTSSKDDNDMGWKVFAGYNINRNFAAEIGWMDLGKYTETYVSGADTASAREKISGFNFDVIGTIPLSNNFGVFAKGGGIYAHREGDASGTGIFSGINGLSDDDWKLRGLIGAGAQYNFSQGFGVRAEWERVFKADDDNDADLFSVSGVFTF